MQAALDAAKPDLPRVLWTLIVVVGGIVQAIATAARRPYDEVLPSIWMQLAQRDNEDPAAGVMRASVTAWTTGALDSVEALNQSAVFSEVDPDELVMHVLAATERLAQVVAETHNEPFTNAVHGIWAALGTEN